MDNQIIKRKGFMGMFLETFSSLNKLNRLMGKTIEIKHEEDWTVIPVRIIEENQVSYIVEDGIITECNHVITEDDGEPYLVCTKCYGCINKEADDFDYSDEWREREDCA